MSNMADDLPGYGKLEGVWNAEFAQDVEDINDAAFVVMESFSPTNKIGPCRWLTRGTNLPEKGMDCLVAFDEFENPFVISWWDGTAGGTGDIIQRLDIDSGPPSSPQDGDIWIAEDVGGENSGVAWQFIYNSDSSSAYKWEFIGGAPLISEVAASETTVSTTYAGLTTAGPSVAVPRAGDYDVFVGCAMSVLGCSMSYDIGGTAAVDADRAQTPAIGSLQIVDVNHERRKTGLTAVTLLAKYKTQSGNAIFANRYMKVRPVRVI
jgi:hypothetical protein